MLLRALSFTRTPTHLAPSLLQRNHRFISPSPSALFHKMSAPTLPTAAAESQIAGDEVLLDAAGVPLTKSALKRIEKEKKLAAIKALKSGGGAKPQPQASGEKKEKKEKPKKEEVVEEVSYKEVNEGDKKGALDSPLTSPRDEPVLQRLFSEWEVSLLQE